MSCCDCCCPEGEECCKAPGEDGICCIPEKCCGTEEEPLCCAEDEECCDDTVCCDEDVVCCEGVCCEEGECCVGGECQECEEECETDEECGCECWQQASFSPIPNPDDPTERETLVEGPEGYEAIPNQEQEGAFTFLKRTRFDCENLFEEEACLEGETVSWTASAPWRDPPEFVYTEGTEPQIVTLVCCDGECVVEGLCDP